MRWIAFLDTSWGCSYTTYWVSRFGTLVDSLLAIVSLGRVVSHLGEKLYEWGKGREPSNTP